MRRSALLVSLLVVAGLATPRAAVAQHPTNAVFEAEWILARQVTSGPDRGLIDSNAGMNYCVPYFSSIAASGLAAATRATGDARYVRAAWDWLDWYAAHMDADGFVMNHRFNGVRWVSTGTADSTEGYAAMFLVAVKDAWTADANATRLQALWPAVGKAVNAMLATADSDWLMYAKPDYPHKFLMDNVEVYEAFRAVEMLAGDARPDPALRVLAGRWTAAMPGAFESFWNETRGGYDIAIGLDGVRYLINWSQMYPGVTAQSWILRTGLVRADRATALASRIEQYHPAWDRTGSQTGGAWWPEVIEAMRFAGRSPRAEGGLATMSAAMNAMNRAWPYHVANTGRMIQQMIGDPVTLLNTAPQAYRTPGTVAFSFSGIPSLTAGGEATFECSLDGVPFTACPAQHSLIVAVEGVHRLRVRAKDAAGATDPAPAMAVWTVDGTAPVPRYTATPPEPGAIAATFAFDAADVAPVDLLDFECSTDGAAYQACRSPWTTRIAGTGTHVVGIRATDPAGNRSAGVTHSWFADGVAPDTTITAGPSGTLIGGDARFEFAGTDDLGPVSFECRLGSAAAFAPCTSPLDLTVGEGMWTFQVRAKDAAGNPDAIPVSRTWSVDRTAPSTVLTDGPPAATKLSTARFSFSGSDNIAAPGSIWFECSLNGAAFARCVSPASFSALAQGAHAFEVRAVDTAGYADPTPARHEWIIDVVAPQAGVITADGAVLAQAPPVLTRAVTGTAADDRTGVGVVEVKFLSQELTGQIVTVQARIECSDAGRRSCTWSAPPPPGRGRYRVGVRVFDLAGNEAAADPATITVHAL